MDPAAICRALFYAAPTPTGFAEIVGGYFPVLHFRSGEIRILDSSGNIERVIPFTETVPGEWHLYAVAQNT